MILLMMFLRRYPNEMKEFFSRNPGLRSRVPFRITFKDYTAAEMTQIAELEADKRGFTIGCKEKVFLMLVNWP